MVEALRNFLLEFIVIQNYNYLDIFTSWLGGQITFIRLFMVCFASIISFHSSPCLEYIMALIIFLFHHLSHNNTPYCSKPNPGVTTPSLLHYSAVYLIESTRYSSHVPTVSTYNTMCDVIFSIFLYLHLIFWYKSFLFATCLPCLGQFFVYEKNLAYP